MKASLISQADVSGPTILSSALFGLPLPPGRGGAPWCEWGHLSASDTLPSRRWFPRVPVHFGGPNNRWQRANCRERAGERKPQRRITRGQQAVKLSTRILDCLVSMAMLADKPRGDMSAHGRNL